MTTPCPRCGLLHPSGSPCFSLNLSTNRGGDDLQPGTILALRFRIERILHRGGMSAVYLATDTKRGMQVALKELRLPGTVSPDEQHEAEVWFARESFLLSMLRHPLIPAFHGSFREGTRSYIAQEYVDGENLEALVARQGPLDEQRVIRWGYSLCHLLGYLHGLPAPVVFRDLKPANIVLRTDGVHLAVVDFGIARPYRSGEVGTVIGTPGYAPPEQYQGLATPQSDLYALGATLHRLLTGYDPEHGTPFTFPPPGQLNPTLSPVLVAIVERAVRLNPAERFAEAAEMGTELNRAATMGTRRAAPAARQRLIWLAVALVGLVLLPSSVILDLRLLRPSVAPTVALQAPTAPLPPFATATAQRSKPPVQGTIVVTRARAKACKPATATHFQGPTSLTIGPDGALWFTMGDAFIKRIADTGQITACYLLPTTTRVGQIITSGNALWFTEMGGPYVGHLTPTGLVAEMTVPNSNLGVTRIVPGAHGSVWVDGGINGRNMFIARIEPSGSVTEFPIPNALDWVAIMAVGQDGSVWVSFGAGTAERLDPSGSITTAALPNYTSVASDVHGRTWYGKSSDLR